MIFREALVTDIQQMQLVRNWVKENMLPDPSYVSDNDYIEFLTIRGKGWVCEVDNRVVGFSIVDLKVNNVWALFVNPDFEEKGFGKKLHQLMLDWYFKQTKETVWLGTSPNTRAEKFYRMHGWKEAGMHGAKEIKFEMSYEEWSFKNEKLKVKNE